MAGERKSGCLIWIVALVALGLVLSLFGLGDDDDGPSGETSCLELTELREDIIRRPPDPNSVDDEGDIEDLRNMNDQIDELNCE